MLNDPTTATGSTPFNGGVLNTLIKKIDSSCTTISNLASKVTSTTAKTASDIRTNNGGKSVIVRLGGLDWIVTFVSLDTSGNVIATLWLNDNVQEKWGTTGLTAKWNLWYDSDSTYNFLSNMYGTSYMRAVVLNNGGKYVATESQAQGEDTGLTTVSQDSSNKFALYTMATYGLTDYIATPNQMSWMSNRQDPSKRNYSGYWLNNESLTSTNTYGYSATATSYVSDGWYTKNSITYCYESKTNYSAWGSDKLWLPSMAETGYNDTYLGLWSTNTAERSASTYSWSRSADSDSSSSSFALYKSGSSSTDYVVSNSFAVRPALLLNLTSAASNAVYPEATITLDKQNGIGGDVAVYLWTLNSTLPTINPPTRTCYTFGGYYEGTNGTGTKIYNADGSPAISTSTFTEDTTLYAYWTANKYTITLNNQSATTTGTTSVTATYDAALSNITPPTKANCLFFGYYTGLNGTGTKIYNADGSPAITKSTFASDTTLYAHWVVSELLIDPTSAISANPFDGATLTTLINMINNNTTGGIAGIKSTIQAKTTTVKAITASDLRANTQGKGSGQSIIVRLGGLDWIVTFVSLDTSGNVIATLWLSDCYQEKWASEADVTVGSSSSGQYKITGGKLTSTWSAGWYTSSYKNSVNYPSNMYGTSYIRAVTLNNGGKYATSDTALSSSYTPVSTNKFALYTMDTYGLTNYIATPNQMSWMYGQSAKTTLGFGYDCPNDSLTSTGNYGTDFSGGDLDNAPSLDYGNKSLNSTRASAYDDWGSDKLWLPSMAETGCDNTHSGLWALNTVEHSASAHSWSRSAIFVSAAMSILLLPSDQYGVTIGNNVNGSNAVRPALLLNLTSAASNAVYPGTAIILNDAGGTGGDGYIIVNEGDNWPTLSALPTKTGYTFGGYYTGTNGTGTKIYNADGSPAISTSTFTEDTTLYAKWTASTYSVTLNANGGTINLGNVTSYTYGTGATLPTKVTRTGYTFAGWYESSTFSGSAVTKITATDYGNKTYYAKWTATITVAESISGAAIVLTTDKSGTYLEGAQITLTAYAKPDYVFRYWVKNNVKFDNSNTNTVTVTVDGNATYTAVFEEAGTVVDGFPVMATTGGYAQMIGQNASEIADADTITVSTYVTDTNYEFVGWYLDNDRTNCLSTAYSCRIAKSVAYKHTLVAVYKLKTETGTNSQTGNS